MEKKHQKIKSWAAALLALILTCLYPCVFLYAQNAGEASLRDILPFFCIFLATDAAALGILGALFRNVSRAGFTACLSMLVVINFTMVSGAIKRHLPWLRDRFQLLILAVLFLLLVLLLLKKKPNLTAGCGILAITFGALTFVSVLTAVPKLISTASYGPPPPENEGAIMAQFQGEKRNVYYLLFDEYGGQENLETYFGFDNSEFYAALEQRGFSVSKTSRNTESCWTDTLVPNLLNLDYVVEDDMPARVRREYLEHPNLVELFRQNSYHINLVNHWNYMRFGANELTRGQHEDSLSGILLERSLFQQIRPIREKIQLLIFLNYRDSYVGPVENAISALETCADHVDGPTLTVSYIQCPHAPFVFGADGSVRKDKSLYWYWKDESLYPAQLQYINSVILTAIDHIQKKDPEAVILLLSDHGARVPLHMVEQFGGPRFDAEKETPVMQNALTAACVPGKSLELEGETGINAARLALNAAVDLNLPRIEPKTGYVLDEIYNAKETGETQKNASIQEHSEEENTPEPEHSPRPGGKKHERGPGPHGGSKDGPKK